MSKSATTRAVTGRRKQTMLPVILVLFGLGSVAGMNRWLEKNRPRMDSKVEEERLYVSAKSARRMSLAFNGLIADWYWMRALQYVGGKVLAQKGTTQFKNLGELDLRLLYPLLDAATTLDPQFISVYEYGGAVLPEISVDNAITLLEKGIANNPQEWRLYYRLGFIHWQNKAYETASETYAAGAKLPGAPAWMQAMSARMLIERGDRAIARDMYEQMKAQSDDPTIERMADLRLAQLTSLDERDIIREVLKGYAARHGRCISDWREIANELRVRRLTLDNSTGAPLDPANTPYVLLKDTCDVDLDSGSDVPYK